MKTVHVITELGHGGASTMLLKLLRAQRAGGDAARVISLTDIGSTGAQLRALGIPVTALGMRPGRPHPAALFRLLRCLEEDPPDLVQTWMYHADLLGGVAARFAGIPVIWGVRHDRLGRRDKLLTRLTQRSCALLSRWVPNVVVFNSEASRRAHATVGYASDKLVVVPNGFDLSRFRPDPGARAAVRRELRLPNDAAVIGLVARFHPHKDHETFLAAAAAVRRKFAAARFVLCGLDIEWSNTSLTAMIDRRQLRDSVHLLGRRDDMERVTAALDVACLSSVTESFPNAVGEAMACGVPCVSTACGDVVEIVGDTGCVVPANDPDAFARAILELLSLDPAARAARGSAARARVTSMFSIEAIARRFETLQHEVVRSCAG